MFSLRRCLRHYWPFDRGGLLIPRRPPSDANQSAGAALIIGLHIVAFFVVLLGGTVLVKALVSEDNFQQRQNWRLEAIAFAFTGIALYQLPYVIPSDSHCAPGKAAAALGILQRCRDCCCGDGFDQCAMFFTGVWE